MKRCPQPADLIITRKGKKTGRWAMQEKKAAVVPGPCGACCCGLELTCVLAWVDRLACRARVAGNW